MIIPPVLPGQGLNAFVRRDGTTPMTANWDIGDFTLQAKQFIADIPIGTQPFVVTSTTVVTNLNADTVDGVHEASFSLANGTRAFTGTVAGITPSAATDLATKGYVDSVASGLDWQDSVIDKDLTTPPGSPVTGDRYIVAAGATGAWAGKDNNITEWDGSAWVFTVQNEGFATWVEDENIVYVWSGSSWNKFGNFVDHSNLLNLGVDTHTQYSLLAGRAGGQTLIGGTLTTQDLTLQDNAADANTITVTQARTAFTHVSSDGSDHSFIDQAVTTAASPTFAGLTLSGGNLAVGVDGTTAGVITVYGQAIGGSEGGEIRLSLAQDFPSFDHFAMDVYEDDFRIHWNAITGFTINGDTGYLTVTGRPWASAGDTSRIQLGDPAHYVEAKWGGPFTIETADDIVLQPTNGNVGVREIIPTAAFHITDATNVPASPTVNSQVPFKITNAGVQAMLFDSNQIESIGSSLNINFQSAQDIVMAVGGGKTGFGTALPDELIHVKSSTTNASIIVDGNSTVNTATYKLFDNGIELGFLGYHRTNADLRLMTVGAATDLHLGTNNTDVITIHRSTQNIGFGTTNPDRFVHFSAVNPELVWEETDQAADNKRWRMYPSGGDFVIGAINDAVSIEEIAIKIDRGTGAIVDGVYFANSDVGIGSETRPTANGGKVMFFGDNAADPTMGNNTAGIYGKNITTTVHMFAIDEGGTAAQLTPHNFSLFTPDPAARYPWSYYASNKFLGVEINVDMWGAIKAIETLAGKQFIYEKDLPPEQIVNWDTEQALQEGQAKERWVAERTNEKIKAVDKVKPAPVAEVVEIPEIEAFQDVEEMADVQLEEEVEITETEAVEAVEVIDDMLSETETVSETKYVLQNGQVTAIITEKPKPIKVPTGKFKKQLKVDVRLDKKTGKLYRKQATTPPTVTETTYKIQDGKVVSVITEKLKNPKVGTGKIVKQLKADISLDKKTGKLYRKLTNDELLALKASAEADAKTANDTTAVAARAEAESEAVAGFTYTRKTKPSWFSS